MQIKHMLWLFLILAAAVLFSSCVTPGRTVISSAVTAKLEKYNTIALIYEKSPSLDWEKTKDYYILINKELTFSLQEMGYFKIYNAKNANKAELWIRIRVDQLEEWMAKRIGINVFFVDAKSGKRLGAITVIGEDNSGPPVLIGTGSVTSMMVAKTVIKGPLGNAIENAVNELINYIKKNQ